jgi:hypothetical protein
MPWSCLGKGGGRRVRTNRKPRIPRTAGRSGSHDTRCSPLRPAGAQRPKRKPVRRARTAPLELVLLAHAAEWILALHGDAAWLAQIAAGAVALHTPPARTVRRRPSDSVRTRADRAALKGFDATVRIAAKPEACLRSDGPVARTQHAGGAFLALRAENSRRCSVPRVAHTTWLVSERKSAYLPASHASHAVCPRLSWKTPSLCRHGLQEVDADAFWARPRSQRLRRANYDDEHTAIAQPMQCSLAGGPFRDVRVGTRRTPLAVRRAAVGAAEKNER